MSFQKSEKHWIGMIAGLLTTGAFLPQVRVIYSLTMYVLSATGVVIWIYYGFLIKSLPNLILILSIGSP